MREQYILQPTESSPRTRNPSPKRQMKTTVLSVGDTRTAGSMPSSAEQSIWYNFM